ncbi:MAG TPA: pseudouridine synthase [Aggregatilineales bacterium]|nr:pseudouridine synthase [Aggregatilineales bacterium]
MTIALHAIRFWKPYGVLSQFTDAQGRATLADYIKVRGLYAAGRLDFDSEGLLILTGDGALNARLTQPRFSHPRIYLAQVERIPGEEALDKLRRGVVLKDGPTRAAQVELLSSAPDLPERPVPIRYRKNVPTAWLQLTLTEGRNRQVRRMTAAIGFPTLRIVRWAVGSVTLAGLQPGQWLPLDAGELSELTTSSRSGA